MHAWPKKTLKERLFWEPHFAEIIHLVGYKWLSPDDMNEKAKPLIEKYGKELMNEAGGLILKIEDVTTLAVAGVPSTTIKWVKLKPEIREMVWPFLGPDAENPPWWAPLVGSRPPTQASPPKRQRRRKKEPTAEAAPT